MAGHTLDVKEPAVAARNQRQTQKPEDPLADLREPDDAGPPEGPSVQVDSDLEPAVDIRPMVTQETQESMVSEAVAAWHADPTSQGFLHGGGQCGCRYLARQALQAAVPVMTEEDLEEKDLEPAHG